MKLLVFALFFALVGCTASRYGAGTKNLTVTQVKKEGLKTKVYARNGYAVYRAYFDYLPDSVKVGTKLSAIRSTKDTCTCLFKRIR